MHHPAFQHRLAYFAAGVLMRKAQKIVTRDAMSTEFIRPYNLGTKVVEATDVAFRLQVHGWVNH